MERWIGKIAVVTGASSGIGAAIAKGLVNSGLTVIGLARRVELVEALKDELKNAPGRLYSRKCDVSDENSIIESIKWVEDNFGGLHVLVNNAGTARAASILSADSSQSIRDVLNTNLLGLLFCTREAFQIMNKSESEAIIINIGR